MRGVPGLVALLVVLGWAAAPVGIAAPAAPPPPPVAEALRGLGLRLERLAIGPTGHATGLRDRRLASAHLELTSVGEPLPGAGLAAQTAALRDAVVALGTPDLVQVEVDLYGPDRLRALLGSVAPHHVARTVEDAGRGSQRWTLDAERVDTTHAVDWYARVVWWRPYLFAGRQLTGMEDWRVTVWVAPGNASPRPAEGATWHAPALLR